jgi:hypothetical protein
VIVEILTADTRPSVRVGIVAPAENAGAGDILGQEVAEPVDTVAGRPRLFAVAVEAMDGDDAAETVESVGSRDGDSLPSTSGNVMTYSTAGSLPSATISRPRDSGLSGSTTLLDD